MLLRLAIISCLVLFACVLSHAQKKDPDPFDRVLTELEAGRTDKALEALDEVIKQYPKNADAYFLRANLTMQDKPAQAISDLNKVIELRPDSGAAYHQRALLRLMNNDITGALKDLDAAIAHNLNDDSVYNLRGQLHWQAGELNLAVSDVSEAIKLNPNNPRLYTTRGELLVALNEFDRALVDFNYLLTWYETDPSARPNPKKTKADAVNKQSKTPQNDRKPFAVEIEQQTVNEAPGDPKMAPTIASAYVRRGLILSNRGNHDAAFTDFGKAIRIDPENGWAPYHRAIEYEYKRDLKAALADILKALQLEPQNGNAMVEQGVILLVMGKDKEAQAVFDVLLQSDRALWQKRIDERTAALRKLNPIE